MQGHITLSKKEKHYQFFYLLLMLLTSLLLLGIIFLKAFESPFSTSDMLAIQTLEQKSKFDQQQKIVQPLLDSTFNQISKLTDEVPQPFEENNIRYGINDIANSFENANVNDLRKEGYPQVAQFYKMYFDDKKIISKKSENIKVFEKQFQDCSIGFKEKKDQLIQRENALKSRN
ncbi:type VI secretion system transmembrane protein TssO [Chryseobacterium sp.]|uniref:type VI secretion system transmembrane protein TssO n=1 Tax=Chryseobacterium sp. TaxID=1871047 RepID=UPI0025C0E557|nr:type VI secretion system transmembrane protein TssO [Chryseobacterium sp.]